MASRSGDLRLPLPPRMQQAQRSGGIMAGLAARCPCLRGEQEEVRVLDYRHCSLEYVPSDVFTYERTLEELSMDANQIRELPRELFYCHGLKKLNVCDNEIISIPPAIASLINLEELDISKNGVVDLPDNIKSCKSLTTLEASVNPLGRLPEGFTQLLNLRELYLNDTFLDYLPGSFGRLSKLKILEIRENHLNTLPKSVARLTLLERLDVGNNEFTELPDAVGSLVSLLELWCDSNQLTSLPKEVGCLKQLMYLDASKNRIEVLPQEIEGCVSLGDLHLSTNLLQQLPESLGRLSNLTTLKVDDNRLTKLPFSIGGLVSLSELNIGANDLEELPPSIGLLRHLRTVYADENFLMEVPSEMGSCSGITVLSLRSNNLTYVPDEIGRIPHLRVLNLSDNKLRFLPFSFTRLKELQALWLAENQTKPLIRLQREIDPDTGRRTLTCYLLPQQPTNDREDLYSEVNSFHPSLWDEERLRRQQIHFDFGDLPVEESNLKRTPTPYPKEMKHRMQHMKNLALKQLNVPHVESSRARADCRDGGDGRLPEPLPSVLGRRDSPEKLKASTSTPTASGSPGLHSKGGKPKSPLAGERHLILRADKERMQKEKSRMHREKSPDRAGKEWGSKPVSAGKLDMGNGQLPEKDGGFLNTSGRRSHTSASPASSHQGTLERDQHSMPQYMSASEIMGRGNSSRKAHSSTSLAKESNVSGISFTYSDFLNGLNGTKPSGSSYREPNFQIPPSAAYHMHSLHKHSVHNPHHRHRGRHHHRHHNHSRSYGSEAGYRSESSFRSLGYESDIGYRSDQETVRRYQVMLGYTSDQDSSVHRNTSSRSVRREGYTSDYEAHSTRARDARSQHSHPGLKSPQKLSAMYTNVAISTRTTIRNDEMYEQEKNTKHGAASSQDRSAERSQRKGGKPNCEETGLSSQSVRASQPLDPGTKRPPPGRQQSLNGPVMTAPERKEDDKWKEQLYQASVRLQKSPSDGRMQDASPQSSYSATSTTHHHQQAVARPRQVVAIESESVTSTASSPAPAVAATGNESPASVRSARSAGGASARLSHASSSPLNLDAVTVRDSPANRTNRPTNLPINGNDAPTPRRQLHYPGIPESPGEREGQAQPNGLLILSPMKGSRGQVVADSSMSHSHSFPPISNASRSQGPGPPASSQSTPLRLANYEKDVAVFKQLEPVSQVSSSTDSGYGHTHIYERLPADSHPSGTPGRGQTSSRGNPPVPPPRVSSCSREGTPGTPYSREGTPGTPYSRSGTPASLHSREGTPGIPAGQQQIAPHKLNSGIKPSVIQVVVTKNPGLGFSIAGGQGSAGNPFRPTDDGIFVTKVQADGPAACALSPADKILEVNGINFLEVEHSEAVQVLRSSGKSVSMLIERLS